MMGGPTWPDRLPFLVPNPPGWKKWPDQSRSGEAFPQEGDPTNFGVLSPWQGAPSNWLTKSLLSRFATGLQQVATGCKKQQKQNRPTKTRLLPSGLSGRLPWLCSLWLPETWRDFGSRSWWCFHCSAVLKVKCLDFERSGRATTHLQPSVSWRSVKFVVHFNDMWNLKTLKASYRFFQDMLPRDTKGP